MVLTVTEKESVGHQNGTIGKLLGKMERILYEMSQLEISERTFGSSVENATGFANNAEVFFFGT